MDDDPDNKSRAEVWQGRVLYILPFALAAMAIGALARGNRTQAAMYGLVSLANAGVLIQSRQKDGSHAWLGTICFVLVFLIPIAFLTVLGISALSDGAVGKGLFLMATAIGWLAVGVFVRRLRRVYREA
jgi:hypothetical protein